MKKLLAMLMLGSVAAAALPAQSIRIKSPVANDVWVVNAPAKIVWEKKGSMHPEVSIQLFRKGSAAGLELSARTENDGLFPLSVPPRLPPGNYFVVIRTLDNRVSEKSGLFDILLTEPSLKILAPNGGETLYVGRDFRMTWRAPAGCPDLKMELLREGILIGIFFRTIDASREHWDWTLGELQDESGNTFTASSSSRYKIRLSSLDGRHSDLSDGFFTISRTDTAPSLRVTRPSGGDPRIGNNLRITWTGSNLGSELIDAFLVKDGRELGMVAQGARPNGELRWLVGPYGDGQNAGPGRNYHIRVRQRDTGFSGNSYPFEILANTAAGDVELLKISDNGGKVNITIRSTFPSLNTEIKYKISRPSWAPVRNEESKISVVFSSPGETSFVLEDILPTDLNSSGDNVFSPYQITLDPDNEIPETNETNNSMSQKLCGHPFFPVIEKVFVGGRQAQRNQTLMLEGENVLFENGVPYALKTKIEVHVRNFGYGKECFKGRVSQHANQKSGRRDANNDFLVISGANILVCNLSNICSNDNEVIVKKNIDTDVLVRLDLSDIHVRVYLSGPGDEGLPRQANFYFSLDPINVLIRYNEAHGTSYK